MPFLGVVGGSGLLKSKLPMFANLKEHRVVTTAGPVILRVGKATATSTTTLVFCQRHNASPASSYTLPADINYAAIALAMKSMGVKTVVGVCSVGTLVPDRIPEGSLVVPNDYYCPADLRPVYTDARGHFVPSFDEPLRKEILDVLFAAGHRVKDGAVYVNSRGARFETMAEVRVYARAGDIIGMTCAHEASACQEIGLSYAAVCMVDNVGHGLASKAPVAPGAPPPTSLTLQSFHEAQISNLGTLESAVSGIISHFATELEAREAEAVADAAAIPAATGGGAAGGAGAGAGASTEEVDTIIHARYVVPVEPAAVVHENYSVVVKDGIIVALLPHEEARHKYHAAKTVHLRDHVLMPGLVNAHTHISMNILRGLADDLPLLDWLTKKVWPVEAQLVSPDFCRVGARHAMAEMIRGGTTCFNDMYFFPDVIAEEIVACGMRAAIAAVVLEFPSAWASSPDEYLSKGLAVKKEFESKTDLLTFTLGPHSPYAVSDATFERLKALSDEHNIPVHVHLHETADECHLSSTGTDGMGRHQSEHKCRPFANLDRLGLINNKLVAAHMTQVTDEEAARLGEAGGSVVHCPNSNLKLASGLCPVAKLMKAGVNVCLGTDSSTSNNSLDMLSEMKLAAVLAKGVAGDSSVVPAQTAIEMATLNGAKALGIDDKIGSLVPGKAADMIAIRLDELELVPMYSVLSHIVYVAGRESVTDVWVAGQQLLDCRRLTTMNEEAIIEETHEWSMRAKKAQHTAEAPASE